MLLEELILNDYGTIPLAIGSFLLKHNSSTLPMIKAATGLSDSDLAEGLALLIQRRIVKFFTFEKVCKYSIARDIIKRRVYFPIYLHYVSLNFSPEHAGCFMNILVNGVWKDPSDKGYTMYDDLVNADIVRPESFFSKQDGLNPSKQHRPANRFLVVNFEQLDRKIFEEEIIRYVVRRYNVAAGSVLRALLRCEVANRDSIIASLNSTKILISDRGALINEKDNVTEYLKYLCAAGIVVRGMDDNRQYFLNTSKSALKTYRMSLLLRDQGMRRIFNMILSKPEIEDKDITIRSLLGINRVKILLLSLQRIGMISQKCIGDYSGGTRIEHSWFVDVDYASLSIIKRIEAEMCIKLESVEKYWDLHHHFEDMGSNSDVWISDLISLATDHLVLSYGLG